MAKHYNRKTTTIVMPFLPYRDAKTRFERDPKRQGDFTYDPRLSSQKGLQMKRLLRRLIPLFLEHLGVHFAVVTLGHPIGHFSLLGLLQETPRKGRKTNTQQHHNNNSSKQPLQHGPRPGGMRGAIQ